MTEQTPEPKDSDDPEVQEGGDQGLDLGSQDTEYIKKSGEPDDIETRDRD